MQIGAANSQARPDTHSLKQKAFLCETRERETESNGTVEQWSCGTVGTRSGHIKRRTRKTGARTITNQRALLAPHGSLANGQSGAERGKAAPSEWATEWGERVERQTFGACLMSCAVSQPPPPALCPVRALSTSANQQTLEPLSPDL